MMKWLFGICSIVVLCCSQPASAEETGWALFDKVQQSVKQHNFDVSYVVLKGGQAETYRWLHGRSGDKEIEHLIPMYADGVDIVRRSDKVYYLLSERPSLVTQSSSIKELPPLLFQSPEKIRSLYDAVAGSSSLMDGRSAQLLRLSAIDDNRHHYWLWVDVQTGFPLRIDTLSEQHPNNKNRALEIWQVTHLRITPELPDTIAQLLEIELPALTPPVVAKPASQPHQLSWLPKGFSISDDPLLVPQLQPDVLSYWLLSDGLHQVSVFVQNSHQLPTQAYRDGATTIYVQADAKQDVTVIGPISIETAKRLAAAVR
ncbi:MucB/RseB C-terminal domain-containing protein [Alishewanella sp. HL-SH06]|uniref:MucB/RseB C-terminal domain-containing protein n=1 Tax=Alishewanella sp. HL-SH06 TaxID=3461144 RepID=UPI0040435FB5